MRLTTNHDSEVARGQRFEFGANWARFLKVLNEERIAQAETSLKDTLGVPDLTGKRFLDAGSGSGLFSLAARRLGASVHSFDYDPQSVACTQELKRRYCPDDPGWTMEQASVLDREYLAKLGRFDVVYSWGVLHHTGAMWQALENVVPLVAENGRLFIAIYNEQGWISRYWGAVKRMYARSAILRWLLLLLHMPYLFGLRWLARALTGRLKLERGMSLWHDMVDWIGGYPFEVARPEAIFRFYRDRGFVLREIKTCAGRHGCNEFVLIKGGAPCAD
jgi:2-polyprenyl-6-hydroxyphenyl methylase/3-demethylubiquinone-9 3-methyltransferase